MVTHDKWRRHGVCKFFGLCYGGLPVMVGCVASLVAIADSTTTELQNTLIRLFMPDCTVLCSVFCVVLIHAFRCNDGWLIELHYTARDGRRLGLQARTGLGTFCTNCGFYIFQLPPPQLLVHVHLALVQTLHHAAKYLRICANFHWRHYTAWWERTWFAGPYRIWHLLHQLRVFIFRLPLPSASFFSFFLYFFLYIII